MIRFIIVGNRMGKTRISRFYCDQEQQQKTLIQQKIIKLCLKEQKQEGILEYEDVLIVYRLYTNLIFIAGITQDENELAMMELLQNFVETLIKYFENVSEQDLVYNMDKVHMILDEMVAGGYVTETSRARILAPLLLIDASKK